MAESVQPAGVAVDRGVRPLAERVQFLERIRASASREAADCERRARALRADEAHAADMLQEVQLLACGHCMGFGRVRVQYAQDDIKNERCPRCSGTGAPPGLT